jgi:hypothetical protein
MEKASVGRGLKTTTRIETKGYIVISKTTILEMDIVLQKGIYNSPIHTHISDRKFRFFECSQKAQNRYNIHDPSFSHSGTL